MEFQKLIKTRRSCRLFDNSTIFESQLASILGAGQLAPSPLNRQPWEFIVINDSKIKALIRKLAEDAKQEVINKNGPGWVAKYKVDFLEEAAVLIVVVVNPFDAGLGHIFGQKYGAIQAASACIQNILLACADLGLGALWFTFFRPEKLSVVLNIPKNLEIAGIVPIGKPKKPIKALARKEPKIHQNRYRQPA